MRRINEGMTSDRDGYGMGGERGQANEQPDNAYKKQKRKSEGGCYRRTEKESEGVEIWQKSRRTGERVSRSRRRCAGYPG